MNDDRRINRRNFFRSGFRELLRPVVESLEEKLEQVQSASPRPRPAVSLALLRPPGALEETQFLATCSRCGVCVSACPVDAIQLDLSERRIGDGAPYIDANLSPCVVCSTLECMTVCPTGALVPTPIRYLDMGTARWDRTTCLRTSGEECRICVDDCPVGEVAIRVDEAGYVQVLETGCVGCGVCQNVCPTTPKSIAVEPKALRTLG